MQKELKTALEVLDLFPSSERFILPVRLDDCEICEKKLKDLNWVDLFPESEYKNGLKKILKVIRKDANLLRSIPMELSDTNVREMLLRIGYYDMHRNPEGKCIDHQYKLHEINGNKVVFDEVTGLMWQQSGSHEGMIFKDAEKWINDLNYNFFAGFNDWRLPTLEEAMGLMDAKAKNFKFGFSYINPLFFEVQRWWMWTGDSVKGKSRAWAVNVSYCSCGSKQLGSKNYVHAVRSAQSFEK